jgi:adenylate cyclase
MDPNPVERKLAAILSADVVGYSRLMAEDESATVRTLTDYREEITVLIRQHRGRVIDSPGDNLLADFPTATDAVTCAVEMQRVLQARNAALPSERKMEFRIGIHLGEVRVEGQRIYGDGVNIAARLEGLAEPGGICISGTVHEQVESKLDLGCEDLGEQSVKNIPKPVRAYRVRIDATRAVTEVQPRRTRRRALVAALLVVLGVGTWWLWSLYAGRSPTPAGGIEAIPGDEAFTVPGFGSAPAIAVLPFGNLSGDPEQEYFADGIAEDLITRLSASGWGFPVIARNSSFVYKGQAVDVKQVSRELGVRYVVEGSVRKAGDRVRISAQLIDAATGAHVWAETYDRELRDIFAVQDEITQAIVGSINPALREAELARVARKERRNLDAYDLAMRGWWHWFKFTKEENARARSLFEQAIKLDPQSSWAFVGLAYTHWNDTAFQWTDTPADSASELMRAARSSVELDANNASAQVILSLAYLSAREPDEMVAAAQRAIELDPSHAVAHAFLGGFLAGHGRLEEGLASAEKAIRLSPRDPHLWFYFHRLAVVHFHARRYQDAVEWARRSIQGNPRFPYSRATLAASYAHLGRLDEARAGMEELLRVQPAFSLAFMRETSVSDPDYRDHYLDGLRKAGLKE